MTARILFVDDEVRVLDGLRRGLSKRRHEWLMEFISSPREAIEAHRRKPFDVVVSDLTMSEANGLDMVLEMKKFAPEAVYIMLTGTADLNAAVSAINDANVFRFFTKPCAVDLLSDGIASGLADLAQRATDAPKMDADDLTAKVGLAALNRLPLGVVVTDRDGHVRLANRAGGAFLAEKDGIRMTESGLCAAETPAETDYLRQLIGKACGDLPPEDQHAAMALSRPSLRRALTVVVTALPAADSGLTFAALFIADPESTPLPSAAAIGKLFDFTPAEARLVRALVAGANLEDAAETCGVTISTARTYLRQAFGKTGTSKQGELLKLVLTTPVPSMDPRKTTTPSRAGKR